MPGAIIGSVLAPVGGMLLDRWGAVRPILGGLSVGTLGAVGMVVAVVVDSMPLVVICHGIVMCGFGLSFTNTQTVALRDVPTAISGDATSMMNTALQFAGAIATAVLAGILGAFQKGLVASDAAYAHATHEGTVWSCVLILLATTAALAVQYAVRRRLR